MKKIILILMLLYFGAAFSQTPPFYRSELSAKEIKYFVGGMKLTPISGFFTATPDAGCFGYNTSTNRVSWYNGTTWLTSASTNDLAGYVPYTGATNNLDLGTFALAAGQAYINHTTAPPASGSTRDILRISYNGIAIVNRSLRVYVDSNSKQHVTNLGGGGISSNAAFGGNALINNTSGSNNTAFGNNTLTNITTGSRSTAIGSNALNSKVQGIADVAVGDGTMQNYNSTSPTDGFNTGVGSAAMNQLTSGTSSTALGWGAGFWNTTGKGSIFIGAGAGGNPASQTGSLQTGNFCTFITAQSVDVGITPSGIETGSYNVLIGKFSGLAANTSNFIGIADNDGNRLITKDATGRVDITANTIYVNGVPANFSGTNLSNTPSATDVVIGSSTGTSTTLAAATTSNAGVLSAADKVRVNNAVQNTGNETIAGTKTFSSAIVSGAVPPVDLGANLGSQTLRYGIVGASLLFVNNIRGATVNIQDNASNNRVVFGTTMTVNTPADFTQTTTAITQPAGTSNTTLATTAFVAAQRVRYSVQTKTANYTVVASDYGTDGIAVFEVDATAGNVTITLDTLANMAGLQVWVIKTDASANTVNVKGNGTTNINQANLYPVTMLNGNVKIIAGATVYRAFN